MSEVLLKRILDNIPAQLGSAGIRRFECSGHIARGRSAEDASEMVETRIG